MAKKYELEGSRFGKLTVISRGGLIYNGCKEWICICDCGKETRASSTKLITGQKASCGCTSNGEESNLYKHGHYGTRTYRIWQNMKTRCMNTKSQFYEQYGGRGITVCEKWMKFEGFIDDMGECPPGMTIDRKNNDQGYEKDNCRWATSKEQSNNRSSNINITINHETKTLKQWCEQFGVKYTTAYWRHKNGRTVDQIFADNDNYSVASQISE